MSPGPEGCRAPSSCHAGRSDPHMRLTGKHGGAIMAYVVRVTHAEDGDRYKVFRALPDAMEMFRAADIAVPETRSAAYLYEVLGFLRPNERRQHILRHLQRFEC